MLETRIETKPGAIVLLAIVRSRSRGSIRQPGAAAVQCCARLISRASDDVTYRELALTGEGSCLPFCPVRARPVSPHTISDCVYSLENARKPPIPNVRKSGICKLPSAAGASSLTAVPGLSPGLDPGAHSHSHLRGVLKKGRVASQAERCYFAAGLSVSFVSGFAASLSSGGLERWSLLISLAPTPGSSGVTLMPVDMAPEVHLK